MSALDTTTESSPHKPPRRSRHPSTASIRSTASTRSPRPTPPTDARISCVIAGAEISGTHGNARDTMEALNLGPVAGPSSPAASIDVIPEVEADAAPALDTLDIIADPQTNLVAFPVSASPPPHRSSTWFGSLSRAKGKEKLAEVQATATASTPNLLAPASSIPIPVPDPAPSMSEPVTSSSPAAPERQDPFLLADAQAVAVPKPPVAKRSWFASSPVQPSPLRTSSPPQPIPHPIYIPPFEDQSSVPSSIDSFPLSESHDTVRGRQRLASLNPSMGRFGINLPLLGGGRAAAVNTASAEGAASTVDADNNHLCVKMATNNTSEISKTVVQDTLHISTITTTEPSTSNDPTTGPTDVKTEVTMESGHYSSWWDYVGWGGAPHASQPGPHDAVEEEGDATPRPPQMALLDASNGSLPDPAKSPSSDEDRAEQTSWYYPWAWYGSTSSSILAVGEASDEKPNQTAEVVEPETAPVEAPPSAAADVADAAATAAQQRYWTSFFSYSHPSSTSTPARANGTVDNARIPSSHPDAPIASEPYPTPSSLSHGSNPIADSINSNRTGWVSFFSNSGTLGYVSRKAITSGEPEVMDIDSDDATDEGESIEVAAAPAPQAASESNGKQVKKDATPPAKPAKPTPSTKPTAPPLTISDSVKRQVANNNNSTSPAPSVASKRSTPAKAASIAPPRTPTPNWVLPTWGDTFHTLPRSVVPQRLIDAHGKTKTMKFVSGVLFASDSLAATKRSGKERDREEREREKRFEEWGLGLPRAWDVLKPGAGKGRSASGESGEAKEGNLEDVLRGCKHVVVIGIHGWFPGTSTKFVNMMVEALEQFQATYSVTLDKITRIPLEGEGTIDRRVEKLYTALTSNAEWMADVRAADVIFVATHSQGSVVSTHLLDRLIRDGHIRTGGPDVSKDPSSPSTASSTSASPPPPPPQRVCCLALCGIHLGPLRYLSSSSLVLPYIQYFENAAAKELFEFQNTESDVSKAYVNALRNVVDNGIKMVYVASLNDQVVPIYSGLFTAASHPLILRALYIDGDAYHSSDFLSNLLVLLLRVLNSGLSDSGLLAHLSEATAGSLNGIGHSTAYEEISTYSLAVKYLFLSNSGFDTHPKLTVEPFDANTEQNDYEIPWSLRDLIADERVAHFFSKEISQLAADFRQWHPKTTILRDIKRKLQPIQRLPRSFATTTNSTSPASVSKL
ncbi:hypothetical protein DFH09DRAFT_1122837 [Mycena vulgaris]|nr:hypothetical protein DFH09DRAFT_1122837 [Mycena vulgaris]